MAEYVLLNDIVDYMEENGMTYKTVSLTIDNEFLLEVNTKSKDTYTLEQLKKAADKCLAHEWLTKTNMGGSSHAALQITQKGIGVARSKKRSDELKFNRSVLKKTSDYIQDHIGLFVVLGFLLTLATFTLRILGDK